MTDSCPEVMLRFRYSQPVREGVQACATPITAPIAVRLLVRQLQQPDRALHLTGSEYNAWAADDEVVFGAFQ